MKREKFSSRLETPFFTISRIAFIVSAIFLSSSFPTLPIFTNLKEEILSYALSKSFSIALLRSFKPIKSAVRAFA